MEKVNFLNCSDGKVIEIEIQTSDITEFGIDCSLIYRMHGGFKKWLRKGYIIANDKRYYCRYYLISDLKKFFKENIDTTEMHTVSKNKYSPKHTFKGERKATNWRYILKKIIEPKVQYFN